MNFADIKRRYDAKGVKALFFGDTEWLVKEVERLHGVLKEIAEADTPYKDRSPRHVSRGAIILTAQQAIPYSACSQCQNFDRCTAPSKGKWVRCKDYTESV